VALLDRGPGQGELSQSDTGYAPREEHHQPCERDGAAPGARKYPHPYSAP